MTRPREAQLELLLTISEGLSRGSHEMLRVSPTDAMHAPSCGLAIRDAVEELRWLRSENERLTRERDNVLAGRERLLSDLGQHFTIRYTSAGCMCPPGANLNCQNSFCPRRNPPGVTCKESGT